MLIHNIQYADTLLVDHYKNSTNPAFFFSKAFFLIKLDIDVGIIQCYWIWIKDSLYFIVFLVALVFSVILPYILTEITLD